jgi:Ni2+-binding GTPase involved in maturation of urease and hydrogenase
MAASSSPTRGTTKMVEGEISELTDFFKKMSVIEDDCRAYHDRGWMTGNLVSFILEVDVPTARALSFFASNLNWLLG